MLSDDVGKHPPQNSLIRASVTIIYSLPWHFVFITTTPSLLFIYVTTFTHLGGKSGEKNPHKHTEAVFVCIITEDARRSGVDFHPSISVDSHSAY